MPRIDYAAVRSQVPMARVLALLDFTPTRRRGPQLRGRCPLPDCGCASDRSFSVNVEQQVYRCFACRSHGNHLDLWAAAQQLPLSQAAHNLCRTANVPLPLLPATQPPHGPHQIPHRSATS